MIIVKQLRNQKGITLIEAIAALSILGMIIMTISFVESHFLTTYKSINTSSINNEEVSYFFHLFSDKARNASKIVTRNNNTKFTDNSGISVEFDYDSSLQTLTYINENGQSFVLLQHVTAFNTVTISNNGLNGIQYTLAVNDYRKETTYESTVYSQIH